MISLTKTVFLERFSKGKTNKMLKISTFFKNAPLVPDPGTTRGGILIKGGILNLNTPDGYVWWETFLFYTGLFSSRR